MTFHNHGCVSMDAVNNEEKKVQDKVNKQKVRTNPKKAEKDW